MLNSNEDYLGKKYKSLEAWGRGNVPEQIHDEDKMFKFLKRKKKLKRKQRRKIMAS